MVMNYFTRLLVTNHSVEADAIELGVRVLAQGEILRDGVQVRAPSVGRHLQDAAGEGKPQILANLLPLPQARLVVLGADHPATVELKIVD
jgi:hypothetical protein